MKLFFYYQAIIILGLFSSGLIFTSCSNIASKNISYYENGSIKKVININKQNEKTEFLFYENGELQSINKFNKNGLFEGEQLWFYSGGKLDRKILFANNKMNGNAYYFYDKTGALKHFRYFKDDKSIFYGVDFWNDSIGVMKASLHFNDNGQIYYKKNFDANGNFLSEEGKSK